jgi:RNA polymerase sigma factor (sigma-70 family)
MATKEFDELLLGNADFLKPFAVNLTKDSEEAKDLYQETLYKALSNKEKYNIGTNIKGWLFTIMRNIFINDYRKRSKQQVILDGTPNDQVLNSSPASVFNNAESELNLKEIWRAVYELPSIFKIPFLLYFEGYKYHEISMALDEPLGTIKSRIHFARKSLRDSLSRY